MANYAHQKISDSEYASRQQAGYAAREKNCCITKSSKSSLAPACTRMSSGKRVQLPRPNCINQ
jgi:hypothetical protein